MLLPQILSNNRIILLKCFDKIHLFLTHLNIINFLYAENGQGNFYECCSALYEDDFCSRLSAAFLRGKHRAVSSIIVIAVVLLTLRFRTKNIYCCRFVYTALSHKKHLLLSLRFHCAFAQKNICCCRFIFTATHLFKLRVSLNLKRRVRGYLPCELVDLRSD